MLDQFVDEGTLRTNLYKKYWAYHSLYDTLVNTRIKHIHNLIEGRFISTYRWDYKKGLEFYNLSLDGERWFAHKKSKKNKQLQQIHNRHIARARRIHITMRQIEKQINNVT